MQNAMQANAVRAIFAGLALVTGLALTGCGTAVISTSAPTQVAGAALKGNVHGGQQPVTGASLQLYAANTSGYNVAAYRLLSTPASTDSGGNFTITSNYTCPSSSSLVYLVATGGNPGLSNGATNGSLAMMAALGSCGSLSASTVININELTTVAAAYALSPFMTSYAQASTSASNTQGLTNAFLSASKLANFASGTVPGPSLPTGATAPVSLLNTLADILAACINSAGGRAGDGSTCGQLFQATTPAGGTAPTDTIAAVLNIAKNPAANVSTLLALSSSTAPFQPVLTSASNLLVSVKYTAGGLSAPSASALDGQGNLWVTNAAGNSVTELSSSGAPVAGSPFSGGLSSPSAIAIDASGDAWVTSKASSQLSVFTPAGVGAVTAATGLSAPTGVAIDGLGNVWVSNSGNNSVTVATTNGIVVTSSTAYSTAGITAPAGLAINPK